MTGRHIEKASVETQIAEAQARYSEGMNMIRKQVADAEAAGKPFHAQIVSIAMNAERRQFDQDWEDIER